MAEETILHVGENSPEEVAFKMMLNVAVSEGKDFTRVGGVPFVQKGGDRKWLLDTYAECLEAVQGRREWKPRMRIDE